VGVNKIKALVWLVAFLLLGSSPPLTVEDARSFSATRPRYLRALPATAIPKGLPDLRAETCGLCHQEIYAEWRISTHARAYLDDAQFLAELEKSKKQKVDWLCMNCHTPVERQLPRLVAALHDNRLDMPRYVGNPDFDPQLQKEAITCATCHVEDGVVLGPYGDTLAPHPVKKSQRLFSAEVCTQCHQAQARFEELNLICVFNTGEEWSKSPQAAAGQVCQSCHMPEVRRPLVTGGKERSTRRHWFGGSLIPKQAAFTAELAALAPHYPPGLAVVPGKLPKAPEPGQKVRWAVAIQNKEAGHYLPSGDPERFLKIVLRARDGQGTVLAEEETQIGIKYQWYPEVKKLSDNRLAPKERRTLTLEVSAPVEGTMIFEVEASRWRISQRNLDYHGLADRYVPGQIFFEHRRELPIKKRSR
jgi:hypothetical protein